MQFEPILAKSGINKVTLSQHLLDVGNACRDLGEIYNLDSELCFIIGVLHDIGKAHPEFIKRLSSNKIYDIAFRHEICSLFFLPLFEKSKWDIIIEGVIAHHKSVKNDSGNKGILDLEDAYDDDFNMLYHLGNWEDWSKNAVNILNNIGINGGYISREEAIEAYYYSLDYIESLPFGVSLYKGVLMSSDHIVSALNEDYKKIIRNNNDINLDIFKKESDLYPLSKLVSLEDKKHTLIISPTGSGKTNLLMKRTKGRIFYVLPFQASINMMYKRLETMLSVDNNIDIRMLHSTSKISLENSSYYEETIQDLSLSDVKVLTPHQLTPLILGTKGYESLLLDVRGTHIIFDEIHVYNDISRKMILSLIQVLVSMDCSVHIGTATIPSLFKDKLIDIMGFDNTYIPLLSENDLKTYNRHIIFKIKKEDSINIIKKHINEKVLVICNTVKVARKKYDELIKEFPDHKIMLIHSRYRRKDRIILENKLLEYNYSDEPCILISTQVIEVSIDINFDTLITECCPIDSLTQRCGRVNRDRNKLNGYKPIYVLEPPLISYQALPYDLNILERTYNILKDNSLLEESEIQKMIDFVYDDINVNDLGDFSIFRNNEFKQKKLCHINKSILSDMLEIDSASMILNSDKDKYTQSNKKNRVNLEIPINIKSILKRNLKQLNVGSKPFIIEDIYYDEKIGILF